MCLMHQSFVSKGPKVNLVQDSEKCTFEEKSKNMEMRIIINQRFYYFRFENNSTEEI